MVAQGASIVNLIIAVIGGMSCIFSVFYILFGIKKDMTAATMTFILAIFLLVRNACLAFLQLTQGQLWYRVPLRCDYRCYIIIKSGREGKVVDSLDIM